METKITINGKDIMVPYKIEDGYYIGEFLDGPFELFAVGSDLQSLRDNIKEDILYCCNYYGEEDDDNLTDGAIKIKQWLKDNIFKKIE